MSYPPPPITIKLAGNLHELSRPMVMGILNVTPDSFYAPSRSPKSAPEAIATRAREIVEQGAEIIDIGAISTRPGAEIVSEREEVQRLDAALAIVRSQHPDTLISIDTYRSEVARYCVEHWGAHIVNDISGGDMDKAMLRTVARLGVPYVLMHMQGTPQTMQQAPRYDNVVAEVIVHIAQRVQRFYDHGGCDLIVDPGFGFGKTLEHNYALLDHLEDFHELHLPLLVGISRKSMIYRALQCDAASALNGTTALHTLSLLKGAHFLRVHDVREACDVRTLLDCCHRAGTTH